MKQKQDEQKYGIGSKVKDKITGFTGIIVGHSHYITGCATYLVQPPCKPDGDFVESRWVDEDRLDIVEKNAVNIYVETNGPDKPAPRR